MEVSDTLLRSFKSRRMTNAEIARATGLAEQDVSERVRRLYAVQNAGNITTHADPTPEYIQLVASAIRMNWPPAEELRRRGGNCNWMPPDADMDLCRVIAATPSLPSSQSRWRSRP